MSDVLPSVAFLGAGSMGGAILRGLVESGTPVDGGIVATNRSASSAAALAGLPGVTSVALEESPDGNVRAAEASRIVVVGVKPAMVPDLLREIAPRLRPDAIVVSLAAGVLLETFADVLGAGVAVVRAMPNTPSLVRRGVAGIVAGEAASREDVALVRSLFETVGTVVEIPEDRIDALGAISGSGPAYVFLLIEELTRVAGERGFSEDDARTLAEGTFVGAAALLAESGEEPSELRRRVTSPKGTTEQAIAVLQDADLAGVFRSAIEAAERRSRELAAG